jgi:Protein of unknown function (DUF2946)
MRRRLQKFLPVVLLALLVQVLAPIAATWASATSDPLQAVPICHSGSTGSGGAGVPDNNVPGSQHAACDLCCLVQAGGALDAPKVIAVTTPYRPAVSVVWQERTAEPTRSLVGSNTQARAPPLSM